MSFLMFFHQIDHFLEGFSLILGKFLNCPNGSLCFWQKSIFTLAIRTTVSYLSLSLSLSLLFQLDLCVRISFFSLL